MPSVIIGTPLVCFCPPTLPLRGFPPGRARIRKRIGKAVRVFIRPPEGGVREFLVSECDGYWVPAIAVSANVNAALAPPSTTFRDHHL